MGRPAARVFLVSLETQGSVAPAGSEAVAGTRNTSAAANDAVKADGAETADEAAAADNAVAAGIAQPDAPIARSPTPPVAASASDDCGDGLKRLSARPAQTPSCVTPDEWCIAHDANSYFEEDQCVCNRGFLRASGEGDRRDGAVSCLSFNATCALSYSNTFWSHADGRCTCLPGFERDDGLCRASGWKGKATRRGGEETPWGVARDDATRRRDAAALGTTCAVAAAVAILAVAGIVHFRQAEVRAYEAVTRSALLVGRQDGHGSFDTFALNY
jgi:hypothetical protein